MDRRRSSVRSVKGDIKRGNWANKTEFLLSCMGYAIGIGNVWRFPYLCYRNGGGAFLVPYLLMLFFCGIPLFFMETTLGQFAGTGCITLFKIAPLFKGAGYAIIIVNFICTTYYNVIIAYPLLFLANCFSAKLPWVDCDNSWNTDKCLSLSDNDLLVKNYVNRTDLDLDNTTIVLRTKTPADEFFQAGFTNQVIEYGYKEYGILHFENLWPMALHIFACNKILQMSGGIDEIGGIVWPLLVCDVIAWVIVYLCIMNGVRSVGKVVYFTATFPFVILFVLLIRGITLPGAWDGIMFYIFPKWHELTNLKVWADAAVQIFFSLGPGWGGIVNMASYNDFRNNNRGDSILVPLLNCGTSIFAGFVVFSVLGFMSYKTGLPVSTVATGGPGLAFVTYPEAISLLPWPHVWAVLFFIMLFLLGLDSCFVQIEAIISSILDEYPVLMKRKQTVALISCFVMFLVSILYVTNGGMYYLQLFDWYAASISVILICLVEVIIVGWTYGMDNFIRDLEFMINEKVHWWWPLCWKFVTPIILTFIFITSIVFNTTITYHGFIYPDWSIAVGWTSCGISIACIPVYMGYKLLYEVEGDLVDRIKTSLIPDKNWGPAKESHRKEWMIVVFKDEISMSKPIVNETDTYHEQFVNLSAGNVDA